MTTVETQQKIGNNLDFTYKVKKISTFDTQKKRKNNRFGEKKKEIKKYRTTDHPMMDFLILWYKITKHGWCRADDLQDIAAPQCNPDNFIGQ